MNNRIRWGLLSYRLIFGITGIILIFVWILDPLAALTQERHLQANHVAETADESAHRRPTNHSFQLTLGPAGQRHAETTQPPLPRAPSLAELENTVAQLAAKLESTINALETLHGEVVKLKDERDELAAKLRTGTKTYVIAKESPAHSTYPQDRAIPNVSDDEMSVVYEIQRGDTLWSIARRHAVSVHELVAWNGINSDDLLHPGRRLVLDPLNGEYRQHFASLSYRGVESALAEPNAIDQPPASELVAQVERSGSEGPSETPEALPQPAPGEFEVDEEAADRALERTLIQTGVLLLPFGQMEVEPSFTYTRTEVDAPTFLTQDGVTFLGTDNVRRNVFDADVQLRFGLPFDSQLDLRFPYRHVDQSTVTTVGFTERAEDDRTGSRPGDIRIGLAKTLLRERQWWGDVVGRVAWDTDTGETTDNDVVLGSGRNEVIGSLSAVKRQDPLAFVGGLSYQKTFEKNDVEPGDQIGLTLGAFLAASPETSLRLALGQTFVNELEVDNEVINGSDQVAGTLTLGASSIIGRRTLLDFSADIGLTDDAPDYSVGASIGMRFDFGSLF